MYYLGMLWALGIWLAMTLWTDLVVVPSLFRSGLGVFQAGELGIKIFGLFNRVEVALALIIVGLMISNFKSKKLLIKDFFFFAPLILLAFINGLYLSPSISEAFHNMSNATPGGELAMQASQKYSLLHRIYVTTDSVKMIWIAIAHVLVLMRFRKEMKVKMAS